MRRVGFDYPNTCPSIDREINSAKDVIIKFLDDLLDDACPMLPTLERKRIAADKANDLYMDLESCFETVRNTNESMRLEADNQIARLQDDLADLEAEVKRFEREAA